MRGEGINLKWDWVLRICTQLFCKTCKTHFSVCPMSEAFMPFFLLELFVLGVAREQSKHAHRNRTGSPIGRWGCCYKSVCPQRYRVRGGGRRGHSKLWRNSEVKCQERRQRGGQSETKVGGIWCLSKQVAAFWQGSLERLKQTKKGTVGDETNDSGGPINHSINTPFVSLTVCIAAPRCQLIYQPSVARADWKVNCKIIVELLSHSELICRRMKHWPLK